MIKQQLKEYYHRELKEIKEHKIRLGFISAILVISLLFFSFSDDKEEATATSEIKNDNTFEQAVDETINKSENKSKFTKIAGLEAATESNGLINPFKVDLEKTKDSNSKIENKPDTMIPAFNPPPQINTVKPVEKVVLTLKGVAISGDKKMAIIQRDSTTKNDSTNSNGKTESLLLSLGDEIDGRRIMNIGKDFIVFDDGQKLYIHEALK